MDHGRKMYRTRLRRTEPGFKRALKLPQNRYGARRIQTQARFYEDGRTSAGADYGTRGKSVLPYPETRCDTPPLRFPFGAGRRFAELGRHQRPEPQPRG